MFDMHKQPTILVTGVSSGIGLAIAEKLLKSGYFVIGTVRALKDAEQLVVSQHAKSFMPLEMDVTNQASILQSVEIVEKHLDGRNLKALVNNAGISIDGPLMLQPLEEIKKIFEVNVFGLIAVTQSFLPLLGASSIQNVEKPGRVVNVGSVSGAITFPFTGAYSASKHAVEALSQAFRRELMPWGVEVVCVEPSFIRTSMFLKASGRTNTYEGTIYGVMWKRFRHFLSKTETTAKAPDVVVDAVMHAIESIQPKTRYPLDGIWRVGRVLPDRWFDKILLKAFPFNKAN
jgi:NAD(P)-dependent dehydrogenase (short-subunit alcohol dehydrogenase family)